MTYTIERRWDGSGWAPLERFTAANDAEACAEFDNEVARTPLQHLRLVDEFNYQGLRCGRVVREHTEAGGDL